MRKRQLVWALAVFSIAAVLITLRVTSEGAPTAAQAQGSLVTVRVQDSVTGNPDATCSPNGQAMIRVTVGGAQNLAALQFDLEFNPAVAAIADDSVTQGSDLPGGWLFASNPNTPGLLRIGTVGFDATAESFAVADVTFDCARSAGHATDLTFANIVAGDLAEDALPAVGVNGTISITAPQVDLLMPYPLDPLP